MLDNVVVDYTKEVVELEGIVLPHRYNPFPHQAELLDVFFDMLEGKNEYSRFALEWHRRAGKDMTFWQLIVAAACSNVGDYCYMLPTNVQSTKVIWNSNVNDMDMETCKFFDFIPPSLRKKEHKSERRVELSNGSNIYIVGSDNYDSNVGMNAKGVVYSEWSLCDPKAQEFFDPMLVKHREMDKTTGWALYCYTPRGKNHAYDTRETALKEENKGEWYFSSRTVDDTTDWTGKPIISRSSIERAIRNGADEDIVKQEYYLDYAINASGAVYGKQMAKAKAEGRICDVFESDLFNPKQPVITYWDLGMSDKMSIWFVQQPKKSNTEDFICIGYYEMSGELFQHYVDYLVAFQERLGFRYYGNHFLPHDAAVRELGTGSRSIQLAKLMQKAGINNRIQIVPRCRKETDGIHQTKAIFDRLVFDEVECKDGITCLESFSWVTNTNGEATKTNHDKFSHGADSLRQLGQTHGILPDEASDKLANQLSHQWSQNTDYEDYNPLN